MVLIIETGFPLLEATAKKNGTSRAFAKKQVLSHWDYHCHVPLLSCKGLGILQFNLQLGVVSLTFPALGCSAKEIVYGSNSCCAHHGQMHNPYEINTFVPPADLSGKAWLPFLAMSLFLENGKELPNTKLLCIPLLNQKLSAASRKPPSLLS